MDKVVSVAIDNQRWDAVGLAMHPTIGGGRRQQVAPARQRLDELSSPEILVHDLVLGRDQPKSNLRRIAVEGATQEPTLRILDVDDVSGRNGRNRPHVGAVDPEVALQNTLSSTLADFDYGHGIALRGPEEERTP